VAIIGKATNTKNRKDAEQPLPSSIVEALRNYLAGKPENLPVWPGEWRKNAAEMLRLDLDAAGIPYRDADGRVADFHALRHSYITLLDQPGITKKAHQELAGIRRTSSPRNTLMPARSSSRPQWRTCPIYCRAGAKNWLQLGPMAAEKQLRLECALR